MPPSHCTICTHPARQAIETALRRQDVSLRQLAVQWSTSKTTLLRHRDRHLPQPTPLAPEVQAARELHRQLDAVATALGRLTPTAWQELEPGLFRGEVVRALRCWDTALVKQWAAQWYQGWR